MTLRERLKADLPKAIKSQQNSAVTALRTILAAIDNAEAVELDPSMRPTIGRSTEVPRKFLTEAEIHGILQREIKALCANIAEYERLGRTTQADGLRAELAVLMHYLG